MAKTKNDVQTIDQLTDRFRELDEKKISTQALLGETSKRLEELLADAEKQFGTRDLGELQDQLKRLESENHQKRQQYQKDLDVIEQKLAEIDEKFCDIEIDTEDE